MSKIISTETALVETAVGPVSVTTAAYSDYSIDDYVRATLISKAEYLRLVNRVAEVNPLSAKDKIPVIVDGILIGGYDG